LKTIIEQLVFHEGYRKYPYKDTEGHLTIGYGYNLDVNGLPKDICKELTTRKIDENWTKLIRNDWFSQLSVVRKKVILDMAYNLGVPGLYKFKKMIQALKKEDYDKASDEMLNSLWAKQVKGRAIRLAKMMRTGEDY